VAEKWVTDADLQAARERFAATIPGFVPPVAYAVARRDGERLTFGEVNKPGGMHRSRRLCWHRSATTRRPPACIR
jgi:hypothetical protein